MTLLVGSSRYEKKFFDFANTGFVGYREDGPISHYTFRNMDKPSVSGLLDFYDYVITHSIKSFAEVDESLFGYPDDYKVFDYGLNNHSFRTLFTFCHRRIEKDFIRTSLYNNGCYSSSICYYNLKE